MNTAPPPPPEIETLIDLLEFRGTTTPEKTAFTFEENPTTFGDLWESVNRFAAHLLRGGIQKGERVLLTIPNGPDFFTAFYGVQRAGGIPVPIYPDSGMRRVVTMKRITGARWVFDTLGKWDFPRKSGYCVPPPVTADDIAFLQYTSGTTGNPKGVQLSHRMLLTNVRQMIAGMEITVDDIFVSWLPCFHDMGLILMTMTPFYLAAPLHLLPTSLQNIELWPRTIEKFGGTFTAAPDFAYRFLIRRASHFRKYDVSTMRVALNAAEPVRAKTIDDFHETFGIENVMVAGYGLAEATVGVSMWTPGTKNKVDENGFVSAGQPFPDVEILILDEDTPASPNTTGDILVRSPANTLGYFENPEETEKLFWGDGYIRTGDLGYLDETGRITIVARKKNLIKHGGRSVAPREIEEIIDPQPEIRIAAVIGVDRGRIEGEQIILFAELRDWQNRSSEQNQGLIIRIVADLHEQLGLRPARTFLVKPGTIPFTHNGKLQYGKLKSLFLEGQLRADAKIVFPEY